MNPENQKNPFHEGFESFSKGTARPEGTNSPLGEGGSLGEHAPPDKTKDIPLNEGLLDQLVDGELSEAQRREAIQQVQTHPDGWRRLALAFLESQAWRQEMPPLVGEISRAVEYPMVPNQQPSVRPDSTRRFSALAWQILALAGGILLAFLGGYWVRDFRLGIQAGFQEGSIVQGITPPRGVPKGFGPSEETRLKEPLGLPERLPSSGWEYVTLAAGTGPDGVPEVVRIPVSPVAPQNRLSLGPPPIPEEILHLLRRWGAEVTHWRHFVPLRIEDGCQVVVPVEQVELYYHPRGDRYQ